MDKILHKAAWSELANNTSGTFTTLKARAGKVGLVRLYCCGFFIPISQTLEIHVS